LHGGEAQEDLPPALVSAPATGPRCWIDARDAKIAVAEAEREDTVSLDELIAELGL